MTAGKAWTGVPRGLALTFSLLVLGTGGGIGHALGGGPWHGLETALATAAGGPADPSPPDSTSSHVEAQCLFCAAGRASSATLGGRIPFFADVGEGSDAVLLPETLAPCSPPSRANAARAPPASFLS